MFQPMRGVMTELGATVKMCLQLVWEDSRRNARLGGSASQESEKSSKGSRMRYRLAKLPAAASLILQKEPEHEHVLSAAKLFPWQWMM